MKTMMKIFIAASKLALAIAAVAILLAGPAFAQTPGATIHGTVTDPAGHQGRRYCRGHAAYRTAKERDRAAGS